MFETHRGRSAALAVGLGTLAVALTACTAASTGTGSAASATGGASAASTPAPANTPTSTPTSAAITSAAPTTPAPAPAPSTSYTKPPTSPVHIKLLNSDGSHYGVGIPVIAYFSRTITDAKPLQQATTVTVDGKPATGAWFFETSAAGNGPIEAHLRLAKYWPAHSKIHVGIPAKGLSAGKGLSYDDSLTLDFSTGAAHIAVVSEAKHQLTLTSDGKLYGRFPVSLGARNTPTARGTKVIMEQGRDISMKGPGYFDPHVEFTQRLTYGGEYLHSAPWNVYNIDNGVDSSNGCTNLLPNVAERLFNFLEVGDVVQYPDANGPHMTLGAGYGDWNVSWAKWQTGGLVPTS